DAYMRGNYSNRLPLTILLGATVLVFGWMMLRDVGIRTADDLMRAFHKDPTGAMSRYGHRRISFKAVLARQPLDTPVHVHRPGGLALVYFATDRPDGWLYCLVPDDNRLHDLKEGGLYRVSGEIYQFEEFEEHGILFLHRCSLRLISEPVTGE